MLIPPIIIGETPPDDRPLITCGKCNEKRLPKGAVEVQPGRYVCQACWVNRRKQSTNKKGKI